MKAKIYNVKQFNGSYLVTFLTNEESMCLMEMYGGEDLEVSLETYREIHSLPQLQLAWKIADKIAKEKRVKKDEIMLKAIIDYGVSIYLPAQEKDMPMLNLAFKHIKDRGDTELTTPSGKKIKCKQLQCYKSIKLYDTKELAILIDGLIDMAKEEGVSIPDYEDYKMGLSK